VAGTNLRNGIHGCSSAGHGQHRNLVYAQEQSVDNGHFESTWIIRCCRSFNDNDKGDSVAAKLRFRKVHGADR
jgi:hypothetical protein